MYFPIKPPMLILEAVSSFDNSRYIHQMIKENKAVILSSVAISGLMWYLSRSDSSKKIDNKKTNHNTWKVISSTYTTVFLGASIIAISAIVGKRLNISPETLNRWYVLLVSSLARSYFFSSCSDDLNKNSENPLLTGLDAYLTADVYKQLSLSFKKNAQFFDNSNNDSEPNKKISLSKKMVFFTLGNVIIGLYSIPLCSYKPQNLMLAGLISLATSSLLIFTAYLAKNNERFIEKTKIIENIFLQILLNRQFPSITRNFVTPLVLARHSINILKISQAEFFLNSGDCIGFFISMVKVFRLFLKCQNTLFYAY